MLIINYIDNNGEMLHMKIKTIKSIVDRKGNYI